MTSTPSITITRLDLQRLEKLLDGLEEYGPAAQALEQELARAQVYVERARSAELAQANGLVDELSLPASQTGT